MDTNFNSKQQQAAEWAEGVLQSLDGMQRAKANPFLYTRILAKVQERANPWEKMARFITRPSFALAATLLFLALNIWVAFTQNEKKAIHKTELVQLLAADYTVHQYQLVEENNGEK
jgi:hypothetical protein